MFSFCPLGARVIAGISLGGNLPGAREAIDSCTIHLSRSPFFCVTGMSSLSRTLAWGIPAPAYDNRVIVGVTRLGVRGFFKWLNHLEQGVPRRGKGRLWPRLLDVDFLFVSPGLSVNDPDLILPHPAISQRPYLRQLIDEAIRQAHLPRDPDLRMPSLPEGMFFPPGSYPVRPPGARVTGRIEGQGRV